MWGDQRQEGLRKVGWNTGLDANQPNNTIRVLECWKTDDITEAVENRNFRYTDICREQIQNVHQLEASKERLDRWLKWQVSLDCLCLFEMFKHEHFNTESTLPSPFREFSSPFRSCRNHFPLSLHQRTPASHLEAYESSFANDQESSAE